MIQLYAQDKAGSVARPVKELKAFQRVTLKPGESKQVSFSLPASCLAFGRNRKKMLKTAYEYSQAIFLFSTV